jgi:Zn-dependent peptidase ImmA (M78 family)
VYKFLKEIIILNIMEDTIFDKISKVFNVEIKSSKFEKDVPSILSKNGKIFYVNEKYSLESQVYSIFHTLAHIQLGTECKKSTSSEEKAVELLTLELLIPEDEIKEYINCSLFKLKNVYMKQLQKEFFFLRKPIYLFGMITNLFLERTL